MAAYFVTTPENKAPECSPHVWRAKPLQATSLFTTVDPQTSPAERIRERVLFVEEVIECVERVCAALAGRGLLDGQVGREEAIGKPLRSCRDLVAFVVHMSVHGGGDDRARLRLLFMLRALIDQ